MFAKEDPRNAAARPGTQAPALFAQNQGPPAYRALATRRECGKTTKGDKTGTELVYLPLPETAAEVKAIAEILGVSPSPADLLLDLQANETGLRKAPLRDYRYLHFATHADQPGKVQGVKEPFILLGQVDNQGGDDGLLTLSEVLGLKLSADMVALSACVTGRGQVMEGEGVVNIARAFQHAGARAVVVSL